MFGYSCLLTRLGYSQLSVNLSLCFDLTTSRLVPILVTFDYLYLHRWGENFSARSRLITFNYIRQQFAHSMSLTMSLIRKRCPFVGQLLLAQLKSPSLQRNQHLRNIHTVKNTMYMPLGNGKFTLPYAFKLAEHKSPIIGHIARSISLSSFTPSAITNKTKPFIKRVKRYVTAFVIVFALVYTMISYSVTSVMYELLKLQINSVPIQDESVKK